MKHKLSFVIVMAFCVSLFFIVSESAAQKGNDSEGCVVVYGDSRSNPAMHKIVVNRLMKYMPLAVFHTGDLVFNGKSQGQWDVFSNTIKPVSDSSEFYACFGNHELHSPLMAAYFKLPNAGKWYSVNILNMHVVVLDNYSDFSAQSPQYEWLVNDLSVCDASMVKIIVMHIPVYSSGPHADKQKKLRKSLQPVFEKYNVKMVFSGHNHSYEKSFCNGIYYIVTAGGGAPLYNNVRKNDFSQLYIKTFHFCTLSPSGNGIVMRAIDTNMVVIDSIYVEK